MMEDLPSSKNGWSWLQARGIYICNPVGLLSAHYTEHALGRPIMKTLLTPARLRYMNSYIGGSHNELISATLKLYDIMSNFAGGRDKKSVLEGFGWEIKVGMQEW